MIRLARATMLMRGRGLRTFIHIHLMAFVIESLQGPSWNRTWSDDPTFFGNDEGCNRASSLAAAHGLLKSCQELWPAETFRIAEVD